MRFHCYCCGKSVTSDLPAGTVLRAIAVCPECIDQGRIAIAERPRVSDDAKGTT